MAKLIQYNPDRMRRTFLKRVKKGRKRVNLEDYGQLNLFEGGTVVNLHDRKDLFELALDLDNSSSPMAEKAYLNAIEKGISPADAYCNLGILKAAQSESTKAIDCFTRSLTIQPRHVESHYNLANMYFDSGNFPLSINHFRIAMQFDPEFPEVYFNLGLAYAMQQNFEEAKKSLELYKGKLPDGHSPEADQLIRQMAAL